MVTKTLNLSPEIGEQSGYEVGLKTSTFPQGEIYLKLEDYRQIMHSNVDIIRINSRCNSSDDLMKIIMAVGAIRHNSDAKIQLFIPYLPYSRQDRVCNEGEAFSLKIIADIFNNLKLDSLITYDAHSNVSEILFDKFTNIDNIEEVRAFMRDIDFRKGREGKALISPDAGASKKAQVLYDVTGLFDTIIYCNKERRTDGSLYVTEIQNYIRDMDVLVVDDICDGGATFIELGKRLYEANVKSASLFVSHGIFSKGIKDLSFFYDNIGTTNSVRMRKDMPEGVRVYDLDY